jgi:hypothetical protein
VLERKGFRLRLVHRSGKAMQRMQEQMQTKGVLGYSCAHVGR